MALVHDVTAQLSGGGTVRSTLTVNDKPGSSAGVYRVGPVVDGQGVVTEAQQTPVHRPMFEAGGLLYVIWSGVCMPLLSCGGTVARAGTMAFGWISWNTLHLLVWRRRILLEKLEERMDDYAVERHPSLAPWVNRDGYVLKLPADVVEDEPEQLAADNAVVNLLPKPKKKASA